MAKLFFGSTPRRGRLVARLGLLLYAVLLTVLLASIVHGFRSLC